VETLLLQAEALELEARGSEAVQFYVRAARSGSGKAAKRLGEIYDKGIPGVSRDYAESLKWYNTARALGEDLKDVRRQKAPASPDLPRRTSAEEFYAQAVTLEMESRFADAARYYRLAARSGYCKAALRLGEIYGKGLPGVDMNYAESLKWLNTARVLGEEPNCTTR
jgi:TPR repeat protein